MRAELAKLALEARSYREAAVSGKRVVYPKRFREKVGQFTGNTPDRDLALALGLSLSGLTKWRRIYGTGKRKASSNRSPEVKFSEMVLQEPSISYPAKCEKPLAPTARNSQVVRLDYSDGHGNRIQLEMPWDILSAERSFEFMGAAMLPVRNRL
jgi:hypothetical protein